jgi:hypothetical protein
VDGRFGTWSCVCGAESFDSCALAHCIEIEEAASTSANVLFVTCTVCTLS